jgi:heat shock protein HtpX
MYSEIARNKQKSWVILALFVAFIGLLGFGFSEIEFHSPSLTIGVVIAAAVYAIIMYYSGSRLSLAVNGAHEIQMADNPRLWRIVENLAIADGLPMPKVYIMDDPAPNAFATGRTPQKAAVCATSGILDIMDDTELQGVFAHEISHIKNYDIRVSMIAFALAAAVSLIADIMLRMTWFRGDDREGNNNQLFIVFGVIGAILAPLIATLIQLAITRRREYLADASGALVTRYPEGLASALEKLETYGKPLRKQNSATSHLFISNPLKAGGISNLFSTHPPLADRIQRLREMGSHA